MKRVRKSVTCLVLAFGLLSSPAMADSIITPSAHWLSNRVADFMDIFSFGIGGTFENKLAGPIPPSIGLYVEATSLLDLGYITHNGGTMEWEGRGAGIYTERRTMYGIGPYRAWKINQGSQVVNVFKDPQAGRAWAQRMETDLRSDAIPSINRWISDTDIGSWFDITEVIGDPAKKPLHRDKTFHKGFLGAPRGWQTWEYVGGEVAVCEPFLTHMGVTARAGVDLSEVADFALGFLFIDFKQDDRRLGE